LKPLRRASPFLSSGRSRKIQDTNAIQVIDAEVRELQTTQPDRGQKFLSLKRLWNGGKKAAVKVGEHFAESSVWGKAAVAFAEGAAEDPK
jgi:hypothetical protein